MFVKKSESTVIRESANGIIVVNIYNGEECALNETGFIFMQALESNKVHDSMMLAFDLTSSFEDIQAEELHHDLVDFYAAMSERGFVEISESKDAINTYSLERLNIEITMRCNERCLHCYIPDSTKDNIETMPLERFQKLVDEFAALGGKDVCLSGGEPLLHPSIMDIFAYCNTKKLRVSLFSNLLSLNDEHIEKLSSMDINIVQTSVYSLIPAIHDKITRVRGSLATTLAAVEHLLRRGIPVQFACPVMSLNRESVTELMDYCKRKNIQFRTNSMIIPQVNGFLFREGISRLTLRQNECMLCEMMNQDSEYVLNNLIQTSNRIERFYTNPKEYLSSPICNACIDHLCISPNGDVYPCPGWKKYLLGNISEKKLTEIWLHSRPLQLLRQINCERNFKECLECKALDFCKRCFVDIEQDNGGELLHINPRVCREAFLVKEIIEKYTQGY